LGGGPTQVDDAGTRAFDGGPSLDEPPGTATLVSSPAELQAAVPWLTLTLVDVGQGDGMVLKMPAGNVVAIDGGPDRYGGYKNFLDAMQPRMDFVLLSHGHSDHYTGLQNAIGMLPGDCVARVFDPGYDRPDIPGYQYFRSIAGCRYAAIGSGMSLAFDPQVQVSVVGASEQPYPTTDGWGINNTSAITYLRYGRFAALFTGDAQTEAERKIVSDKLPLRANVMKIGHHGSCNATATSLLKAVAPTVALISAANPNDFGHPHCQTIGKLAAQGTHWYRTDVNGTVVVQTDGERYAVTYARGNPDDPSCPRACASPTDF
jgi:beta-lactamase superfamily II metal-dependent hydrolase